MTRSVSDDVFVGIPVVENDMRSTCPCIFSDTQVPSIPTSVYPTYTRYDSLNVPFEDLPNTKFLLRSCPSTNSNVPIGPYHCFHCNLSFITNDDMQYHVASHVEPPSVSIVNRDVIRKTYLSANHTNAVVRRSLRNKHTTIPTSPYDHMPNTRLHTLNGYGNEFSLRKFRYRPPNSRTPSYSTLMLR